MPLHAPTPINDLSNLFPGSSDADKRKELADRGQPTHVVSHGVSFATDMPPMRPRVRRMLAEE